MIYVTLGTQARDFSRLLKILEKLIIDFDINEEIVAQIGYTKYRPNGVKCFDFISEDKYQEYIKSARVIISHAGTGALFSSIKKGKKTIAVARLKKYGEMVNDHQVEIVKKLSEEGYILDGTHSLSESWKRLDDFKPREFDFCCTLPEEIEQQVDGWLNI